MLIDPGAFEACFTAWVRGITSLGEQEIVAIDGKTVRRSFDRGREQAPLHLVSAWASQQGVVLAQRQVDGKSNEITAIPKLLDVLNLKNTLVTLDAMGCQKTIAQHILNREADYLLALKANHKSAQAAVQSYFDRHCFQRSADLKPAVDAFDESHGRLARRRVFVSAEAATLSALAEWPSLRTVLAVASIRSINGSGKVEAEIRYFLSSASTEAPVLAQALRRHGSIENNLHGVLDVNFREDDSRLRDPTAVRNFCAPLQDRSESGRPRPIHEGQPAAKRKRAAWDDDYMGQILTATFMR